MGNRKSHDRKNWEHRKDPDFQVGESMPGTVGDSDGTLHDRLGEQPVTEDVEAFEPGQKARQRQEETESETTDEEVSVKELVDRL